MRIEISKKSFSVDVKRFYLPIRLFAVCPTCGAEVERDLDGDYLSYPDFNKPEDICFYHSNDDGEYWHHEWKEKVIFSVDCKPVAKRVRKKKDA